MYVCIYIYIYICIYIYIYILIYSYVYVYVYVYVYIHIFTISVYYYSITWPHSRASPCGVRVVAGALGPRLEGHARPSKSSDSSDTHA